MNKYNETWAKFVPIVIMKIPASEYRIVAVRSGGSGGQHVNKVSTRVELYFDVANSASLSDEQKITIQQKMKSKITEDGILRITEDKSRSQHANREAIIKKLYALIGQALKQPKKRIAVKVSKAAKKKRVDNKKKHSEKKSLRKKNWE
jgi:ribosome-associated protein